MTNSKVLAKLRAGEYVVVAGIGRIVEPWLSEVVGRVGYDCIWLDLEHRAYSYQVIDPISLACRATGIDLMVRVRKTGYDSPMRALEFGANGLMVPHCHNADEARQWVDWVRFPPLGKRGFDGAGADADYGFASPLDHLKHGNQEVFLALQIEDAEALDHVEEIAAVEGVDLLFVGPADLSISLGAPLQFDNPALIEAFARVNRAVRRVGKWWGTTSGSPEAGQLALDRGARMVTGGSDHGFLLTGFQDTIAKYRALHI
jgi:4-hydroxy-2-oxoheptanedioate aldolase